MAKTDEEKINELAEEVRRFGDAVGVAEFIQKVGMMRNAQKLFFKTRERKWLKESQHLEKVVDTYIADITSRQKKLF